MKRWHVRSLVIVILGVLGMAALAFRPALVPDVVEWGVEPVPLQEALGAQNGEDRAEMEVEYRWAFVNVEAVEEAARRCERAIGDEAALAYMMDRLVFPPAAEGRRA